MGVKKKFLVELREKSEEELDTFVHENKKALFDLRAETFVHNKTVKPHLFSQYKKDIARALTIKQEKKGKR